MKASVAFVVLLLLAACSKPQIEARPAPPPVIGPAPAQAAQPDARLQIISLLNASRSARYTARYTETVTDPAGGIHSSTVEVVHAGLRERTERQLDVGNRTVWERLIAGPDGIVQCLKDPEWECMRIPAPENLTDPLEDKLYWDRLGASAAPGQDIAGAEGRCFSMETLGEAVTLRQTACYALSGAPLLLETEASDGEGGSYRATLRATLYRESADDSAFTPPAEPRDITEVANESGYPQQ